MGLIYAVALLMLLFLDYKQGWDWKTYIYSDFWAAKSPQTLTKCFQSRLKNLLI